MPDESDRKRLAEAVRRDRLRIYGTVEKARLIAEISRGAWDHVESGDPVREFTLAAVERTLGWHQGRADEILRGESAAPDMSPTRRAILEDPDLDDEHRAALLALFDRPETPSPPSHQRHQSA